MPRPPDAAGRPERPGSARCPRSRRCLRRAGQFGVEVPLRALFEGRTVAEMAGRVDVALEVMDAELAQVDPEEMAQLLALLRESTVA